MGLLPAGISATTGTMFIRRTVILLMLTMLPARAETRSWTLPDGSNLQAQITGIHDGKVALTPVNGKTPIEVPAASLKAPDRAVVAEWVPPGRRQAGANSTVQRNAGGWPLTVTLKEDPATTVVEENRAEKRFVYRSDHFEFHCTQRLNGEVVREFSRLFEVTFETVAALPLRLAPEPPRGYWRIVLYPTKPEYFAAGGPEGSGGLFRGSTGEVMVPLPNLGVERAGQRWIMKNREGNQPLIHEVTHQVMGSWLTVLPVWLVEGSAEYLAAARYTTGKLTLHASFDNMFAFLTEQKGISGRDIDLRHPKRLMVMSLEKWASDLASREGLKNYYSSMLLFYYFSHLEGDGSGRGVIEYFQARPGSKTPDDDTMERDRLLLHGRGWDALWEDVLRAFAGIKIRLS